MIKIKQKWLRVLLIIIVTSILLSGGGYIFLQYKISQIEGAITGCELENKNFVRTIDFEYVNNWIVVYVKVAGSKKELPFIFDTGAQTVVLDSLLNEIGTKNYKKLSFTESSGKKENAFNNEIITINQMEIGGINFKNTGAISAQNSKWEMLNCISAYGIIGYNLLKTCNFQIDYNDKQIILTDDLTKLSNYNENNWINYKPSAKQESPIIQATINDSIPINLFFDTGSSGGFKLYSDKLYNLFVQEGTSNALKYFYKPSIRIRGESDDTKEAIKLKTSKITMGNISSTDFNINIYNEPEREYTGFVGNAYLKNFIITLDYSNRRIGFIQDRNPVINDSTFGFNYVASENNITVSSVFEDSEAYKLGIRCGDEIYSINEIMISDLSPEVFCEIYRNEFKFANTNDSLMFIEVVTNNGLAKYELEKQEIF